MSGIQIAIEPKDLPSVELVNGIRANRAKLPHSSGIYFFLDADNKPLYIGASIDINVRVTVNHPKLEDAIRIGAKKIAWWLSDDEKLFFHLELKLIKLFKPILNKQHIEKPSKERVKKDKQAEVDVIPANQLSIFINQWGMLEFNKGNSAMMANIDGLPNEELQKLLLPIASQDEFNKREKFILDWGREKEKNNYLATYFESGCE